MNAAAYLDGFVACALAARAGGIPADALTGTFEEGYAEGWRDALVNARIYRCMKAAYVEYVAGGDARHSLALRSSTVRGCERCKGTGDILVAIGDPDDYEREQCPCVDHALRDIETIFG